MSILAVPTKQKALVIPVEHAAFEVQALDVTTPSAGEVLVRAETVGLNLVDWMVREYNLFKWAHPCIVGCEAAGTVVQIGEGVTSLAVGDKVFHSAWNGDGYTAFKQYNLAPAEVCVKVPSNLTLDQAGSVSLVFTTALIGLYGPLEDHVGAGLAPFWRDGGRGKYAGQPVLILGGASGVGQAAIQYARISGFSPIITTASPRNAGLLTSLGATHVLERTLSDEAFAAAVRGIVDPAGAPLRVVFDSMSDPAVQRAAFELLAPGGTFVSCTGGQGLGPEQHASKEKQFVFAHGSPYPENHRALCVEFYKQMPTFFENGELKPNNVEVIPGGWEGAIVGLKRMHEAPVSAQKLVVHPQETA